MLCQIWTFRVNIIPEITKRPQITQAEIWPKTTPYKSLQMTTDSNKRILAAMWTFSACQSHTWVTGGAKGSGPGKKM